MSGSHARLGPSNKRWPECAGSIREEETYPDIPGEAAIDGIGSHLLFELCLVNNVPAAQYDQQIIGANHIDNINGWLVDPERCKRVQMGLDYIARRVTELQQLYEGANVTVESESRSDPGGAFGRDDWWGTCDITITVRHPMTGECYFIEVADYKDGRGYVSEKDNSQNISYLFGKLRPYISNRNDPSKFNHLNVSGCRMTIIQPRTNPAIRYQCSTRFDNGISVKSVIESAKQLAIAANATDDPDAPLVAGKHCQWCKANPKRGGHCIAQTEQSLQVVDNMNEVQTVTGDQDLLSYISKAVADPASLTVEMLGKLGDAEEGFQAAFDKVKAEIQTRIEQGVSVPGYAMGAGKGANVWNADEQTIVKKLKGRRLKNADIYPAKLISPAAVMKLSNLTDEQKEKIKKELITHTAGKLTLKKVAYEVAQPDAVQLMFADVPTEEVSFF